MKKWFFFFGFAILFISTLAFAQVPAEPSGIEQAIKDVLQALVDKFPLLTAIYMGLCGLYTAFCAVASMTKTDKDDKVADKLKIFFSLPIKKK